MSDDELMGVRIPSELKRMVDADSRTNQEVVEAALWREFGGKRKGLVDIQIERKQDQLESVASERDELSDEVNRIRQEIEALKATRQEIESGTTYREDLLSVLKKIEDGGGHIWPSHDEIEELATQEDKQPEEVIDDARELAAEEDMDILTTQFVRAANAKYVDELPIREAFDNE